jgi:hypothetical protein
MHRAVTGQLTGHVSHDRFHVLVPATPQREIASRAGCWLRSTAEGHWSPSVTVQAVTARCVGRNSQNRGQRACFAAVGWDGASWTQLSHHTTLARAQATPLACNRHVRIPLSGHTPHRALGGAMVPTILEEGSSTNSVFLDRALPTPLQPGAPHSTMQQASLLKPASTDVRAVRMGCRTVAQYHPNLRTSTPARISSRPMPCLTQRMHAIGLWAAAS